MTDYAGDYGGGFPLTCILYEGAITVSTSGTHYAGGKNKQPSFAFAAEISVGDYVGLFVDTANTLAATTGIPVVTTVATTAPIFGRVVTEPQWANAPSSTTSTWAADLARGAYRKAIVEFFGVTAAHVAATSGDSTALTLGCPVKWDLSANGWMDAGTTVTAAFTFHYDANTAASDVLIGFSAVPMSTGDADCIGYDTIT